MLFSVNVNLAQLRIIHFYMLLKKIGRILILSIFIILASFGMGLFGINYRERYLHKETRIELSDKRDEERESEDDAKE